MAPLGFMCQRTRPDFGRNIGIIYIDSDFDILSQILDKLIFSIALYSPYFKRKQLLLVAKRFKLFTEMGSFWSKCLLRPVICNQITVRERHEMKFTPLIENQYSDNILLNLCVWTGAYATAVMLVIAITISVMEGKAALKYWWITSGLLIFTLFSILPGQYESDKIKGRNQAIVEENMKQKYDIHSVLWNEARTNVEDYEGKSTIAVLDSDDNIIFYRYQIDPNTFEPSLVNLPDGGFHKTERPAKELLKTN